MIKYVSQEGFYTLNIKRLFLYVIACGIFAFGGMGAVHACTINEIDVNDDGTNCQTAKFTLTTTATNPPTTETDSFQFYISAAGTFYVDCGDDGTLTSTAGDITNNDTITRSDVSPITYTCTWDNATAHTIRFGGSATGYSTSGTTAAVRFNINISKPSNDTNAKKISSISGSLGQIFSTVENPSTGSGQPRFYQTFYRASNMTGTDGDYALPQNLFDGISGAPASNMFNGTFNGCSRLSGTIPSTLFSGISGAPADWMFFSTFYGCSGLTGSIPSTLFGNISGAPAQGMFYDTFNGCSGLNRFGDNTYVPGDFLSGIGDGTSVSNLVVNMFAGTQLDNTCPAGTYTSTRAQFNNAGKPWCTPCPDGTSSVAGATSANDCVPAYTITYNCGGGTGDVPENQIVINGDNFTVAQNTCTAPNNQHFTGWLISDTDNTIVQPGDAFQYLYTTDKTLTAQWENDVINIFLNWFNDNTQLDVPATSQTCEYGGGITLPDDPSKTGYTFQGWRLKLFDMVAFASTNPTPSLPYLSRSFLNVHYDNGNPRCDENGTTDNCSNTKFSHLNNGEWSVSFGADGTIKGIARCSKTAGETNGLWNNGYNVFPENIQANITDNLNESGAQYCWCRASGHAESGSNNYQSVASPAWVFDSGIINADGCANTCAYHCTRNVHNYSAFRNAIFGVTE